MTTVAEAFVTLRPETKGFEREAQAGIGTPMKKLGLAMGAGLAVAGVKDFIGGAIGEAREANKVAAQTEAVIKSTGAAAGLTAKDFESLAGAISKKTGIDDEQIQSAENLLATFTNVKDAAGEGNDVFSQATKTLVDMGAALGTDASGSAIQLGKALNDPIKGISALTRVGVTFTDQQKDQIKSMVEAGDVAGAQKVILAELNKEFGGSAEAQATSADKLNVAWGNLQETVGTKLVPIMESVSTFLVEHQELIGPLALLIGGALVAGFTAWAVSATSAAVATLAAISPVVLIGAAIAALAILIVANWDTIVAATKAAWEFVKNVTTTAWNAVYGAISGVLGSIVGAVSGAIGSIVSFFTELPGRIVGAVDGALDRLVSLGKRIAQSIIRGVKGAIGGLGSAVLNAIPGGGVVQNLVSKIPGFATGGVVPGALGAPMLAVVHGGEEVLTPAQRSAGSGEFIVRELHVHTKDDPMSIRRTVNESLRDAAWQLGWTA